jgi:asparagine synthase (glutamine-hydrolysing)
VAAWLDDAGSLKNPTRNIDMCGIAGRLDLLALARDGREADPAARATVEAMCDSMVHRGPDGGAAISRGPLTMGMRRLSIIDLEGGMQPIANEDESLWLVCNGEIYNYRELAAALKSRGHRFRTASDVEVILHLYEDYELNFAAHLRGMFAFALWDARLRRLIIGRDRLGQKPLYFTADQRQLLFASELKALVAAGVDREPNLEALHHYLTLSYVPAPFTCYKRVHKLMPGHLLVADESGIQMDSYWRIEDSGEPEALSVRDRVETLRGLLADAVRSHLVSDVPVGVFLSGGLDSATVLSYMREQVSGPISTFSVGFQDPSFNELARARATAKRFGTDHHELVIPPSIADTVPALIDAFDEPFADSSAIPVYFLSRFARTHVKVVLSGEGGDEIFGGYETYVASKLAAWYRQLPALLSRRVIPNLVDRLPVSHRRVSFDYKAKRFVRGALRGAAGSHLAWKELFSEDAKAELWAAPNGMPSTARLWEDIHTGAPSTDWLARLLWVDMQLGLPDDMLTKVDRMTMAHSLEARVPLLDHPLVEFMARVPSDLKLRRFTTKYLMRRAVRGRLPRTVLRGPKRGFNVPMPGWLAGDLRSFMTDTLSPQRIAQTGIFQPAAVTRLVDQHLKREADHSRALWALIVLEHWARRETGRGARARSAPGDRPRMVG